MSIATIAILAGSGSASAHVLPKHPDTLPSHLLMRIHHQRNMTWHYQDLTGNARTPYYYWAERKCENKTCRYNILLRWHARHHHWQHLWEHIGTAVSSGPVPSWAITFFNCISKYEEYTVQGQNTSAGYFGMVSAPSAYPGSSAIVSQFGDSWLNIPLSYQYVIAYAEYQKYGTSPWTTAYHCA